VADLDDRGQLIAVTGFALAVTLVALALVLNAAIFSNNLASRGDTAQGGDAVQFRAESRAAVGEVIAYANEHNDSSQEALAENVTAGIDGYARLASHHGASSGVVVDALVGNVTNGTTIEQADESRFESDANSSDWTLVTDVSNTREFRIRVTAVPGSDFRLFANGSNGNSWRVNVTASEVGIEGGNGNDATCSWGSTPFWINVTEGTVDGDDCVAPTFAGNVTAPYNLTIQHGDGVEGNYTLVVDNSSLGTTTSLQDDYDTTGGSPFVDPAVYNTSVRLVRESPELTYNETVRIAPGEADG